MSLLTVGATAPGAYLLRKEIIGTGRFGTPTGDWVWCAATCSIAATAASGVTLHRAKELPASLVEDIEGGLRRHGRAWFCKVPITSIGRFSWSLWRWRLVLELAEDRG